MRILSFLFIFSFISIAVADPKEERSKIESIAAKMPPPVRSTYETNPRNFYLDTIEKLTEPIMTIASKKSEYYDCFLSLPNISKWFQARADLAEAMLKDVQNVDLNAYRLDTYIDKDRPLMPRVYWARIKIAEQINSMSLVGHDFEKLKFILQSPAMFSSGSFYSWIMDKIESGLEEKLSGSRRAHELLRRFPLAIQANMLGVVDEQTRLVARVIENSDEQVANALMTEIAALSSKTRRLSHLLDFLKIHLSGAVHDFDEIYQKPFQSLEEIEGSVVGLGKGLAWSLRKVQEMKPVVMQSFHSMDFPPVFRTEDSVILLRHVSIEKDLFWLFSGGGWHRSNLSLSDEMMGPDGQKGIQYYQSVLFLDYVLAVGAEISRLTKSPEGRATLGEATQLRLGQLRSLVQRARGQSIVPTRASVPATLQQRRGEIEDRLWKAFFEAAGFNENSFDCMISLEFQAK